MIAFFFATLVLEVGLATVFLGLLACALVAAGLTAALLLAFALLAAGLTAALLAFALAAAGLIAALLAFATGCLLTAGLALGLACALGLAVFLVFGVALSFCTIKLRSSTLWSIDNTAWLAKTATALPQPLCVDEKTRYYHVSSTSTGRVTYMHIPILNYSKNGPTAHNGASCRDYKILL